MSTTPTSALVFNFDARHFKATVRVITKGQKYGLDFCLTHEGAEPMVEFYDRAHDHTAFGQFTSRYYLSTFMGRDVTRWWDFLSLVGYVDSWKIRNDEVEEIQSIISKELAA